MRASQDPQGSSVASGEVIAEVRLGELRIFGRKPRARTGLAVFAIGAAAVGIGLLTAPIVLALGATLASIGLFVAFFGWVAARQVRGQPRLAAYPDALVIDWPGRREALPWRDIKAVRVSELSAGLFSGPAFLTIAPAAAKELQFSVAAVDPRALDRLVREIQKRISHDGAGRSAS